MGDVTYTVRDELVQKLYMRMAERGTTEHKAGERS